VKNLGDGLMVGFDATLPALSCAAAMQQAIDRHNRRSRVTLAIRIGISTGDVTVEENDYFGDAVVEAARLCAVAQGGQILTTDVVKALARRSGHNFANERELELKGLNGPVQTVRPLQSIPRSRTQFQICRSSSASVRSPVAMTTHKQKMVKPCAGTRGCHASATDAHRSITCSGS
jgi:class 3 adenylate cyclase